jgi:hypothetical protein
MTDDKTIFFLHIPKCAGTTLVEEILKKRFSSREMLIFYELNTEDLVERLKGMSDRKLRRIRCIAGHFAFGIHEYYQIRPSAYITILRNPVDRVISHYKDVVRRPSHYLHDQVTRRKLSLKEYMESGLSLELNNGQTRILAGIGVGTRYGVSSPELLDLAKKHLDMCEIVGISEDFPSLLGRLEAQWGWHIPHYADRNVSEDRIKDYEIDNETLQVIEGYNDQDMELYRYAVALIERRGRDLQGGKE